MRCFFLAALVAAAATLAAACSPVFDWRDVRVAPASAAVVLPCKKPDRTEREVPLAGVPTKLSMAGCEAGGATFAVMAAVLPEGQKPDDVLAGWQQATLANMQAASDEVARAPFRPLGGLPLRHAEHWTVQGRGDDGRAVQAQAAWTAHTEANGDLTLLHAVMYSRRKQDHDIDLFFESIRW